MVFKKWLELSIKIYKKIEIFLKLITHSFVKNNASWDSYWEYLLFNF